MDYLSTRGQAPRLSFEDVLLTGLARDGGLYVPNAWPSLPAEDQRRLRDVGYADLSASVVASFCGGAIGARDLETLCRDTYGRFHHPAAAPLIQLDDRLWLLELFHGPTLAFKDYALQLVGGLFDHVLARRGERLTIVGATSGDTGSAAIEACRDRDAVDIFMLHPHGRVSPVQRRQMTTVDAANVYNIAIEGTFDDCQDLVKAMFNDTAYRDALSLSAVNSINFARIAGQVVYYVAAAVALGAPDRTVSFSVPTGNFGNVYAAYGARAMGLPIDRLVVGSNANDILDRFFRSGEMRTQSVVPTLSPSMDIQISSNLERLLFDLFDRDGPALADAMIAFRRDGVFAGTEAQMARARTVFTSHRSDDAATRAEIGRVYRDTGALIDPHTAVGLAAGRAALPAGDGPMISLACAHPAKFPDAVEQATGVRPRLPDHLADLMERPEHVTVLPNDLATVQRFVRDRAAVTGQAA